MTIIAPMVALTIYVLGLVIKKDKGNDDKIIITPAIIMSAGSRETTTTKKLVK